MIKCTTGTFKSDHDMRYCIVPVLNIEFTLPIMPSSYFTTEVYVKGQMERDDHRNCETQVL